MIDNIDKIKKYIPVGESLLPYQLEGVHKLSKRNRSLLADEPGLGKTPQYMVLSNIYESQLVVIICPKIAKGTLLHEWNKWDIHSRKAQVIHDGKTRVYPDTSCIIINYDLVLQKKWADLIKDWLSCPSSLLICDEAQAIRKWEAKRTRLILRELWPVATHGLLVTGSPMYRGIMDLHPLFSACEPDMWGTYDEFGAAHSYSIPDAYSYSGYRYIGKKNVRELVTKAKTFMVRRFQSDVQKDLPPKLFSNVYLDVPDAPDESEVNTAEVEAAIAEGREPRDISLSKLRRELGLAKVPAVTEWLENFIDEAPIKTNGPIVIFAYHREVIEQIYAWTQTRHEHQQTAAVIYGGISDKKRQEALTAFQNGRLDILIAQIDAAGTAINLFASHRCVFAELHYVPEAISQAVKRLHRQGQKLTVYIYFLLAENSIETRVIQLIRSKLKDIKSVMGKKALK